MRKSSAFLLVILLTLLSVLSACGGTSGGGDNSLQRVKDAGKLTIAIDPTYPPMEFTDEDGNYIGFDIDLAREIAKELGVEAEFIAMDWDGILAGLTGGRYDVIMSSMNITEERLKQANFVEYAQMSQVFVSRKGVEVKTPEDLAGRVVAVQAETTSHIWVDEVKAEKVPDIKEIRSFKAATEAFLEVKNGRADVIVIDEPVGLYYAAQDPETFVVTGRAIDPEPVGIALRKEDVALKEALEKAVQTLRENGTYAQVSQKWFGGELGK